MARIRRQKSTGNGVHQEKQKVWTIAVYIRLSREDGNEESESVINQKKILSEYLDQYFEDPYEVVDFYIEMKIPKMIQFENMNPPRKGRNKGF